MIVFFGRPPLLQTSSIILSQTHVVVSSESVFHVRSLMYRPDIQLRSDQSVWHRGTGTVSSIKHHTSYSFGAVSSDALNMLLHSDCWPSVGPQPEDNKIYK